MMRYLKSKIISVLALGLVTPALFPVSVFAETPSADYVEEKRLELELREREYLEALEKENIARDVLINTERALDDAQEKYDYAMEQYETGVKGFFEWVIETEKDPARIEDAKDALKALDRHLKAFEYGLAPNFADPYELGKKESPTNITRIFFLSNWLDMFEKYNTNTRTSLFTSHIDLMNGITDVTSAQAGFNKEETENGYFFDSFTNSRAYFPLGTYVSYNGTEMPELSFEGNEIPENFLSLNIKNYDGIEYTPKQVSLSIGWGTTVGNENMLSWEVRDIDIDNQNSVLTDPENYLYLSRHTYTLSEYAQAIRDYYALVDPVGAITLLNTKNDDFSNAQKEYDFSEQHTINCLSRLRGAEKDYEEAVALFEDWQAQQVAVNSHIETMEDDPQLTEQLNVEVENQPVSDNVEAKPEVDVNYQENSVIDSITPIATGTINIEVKGYEDSSEDTSVKVSEGKDDRALAQVISYIFNGGAIALIIPSGLFRKKEVVV